MRPDIIDLEQFYATSLGQVAQSLIASRINAAWPDVSDLRLLGVGYSTPYLDGFRDQAERVLAAMPESQGVIRWPRGESNLVVLSEEMELPLADNSVDRVLLAHSLENADQARPMLREIWRVMASNAELLIVVPNRRGLWARFEGTPFGSGQPFSPPQLVRLLRETMFLPYRTTTALFIPPVNWRYLLKAASGIEQLAQRWGGVVAGVLVVQAGKQIYAASSEREKRPRHLNVPATTNISLR